MTPFCAVVRFRSRRKMTVNKPSVTVSPGRAHRRGIEKISDNKISRQACSWHLRGGFEPAPIDLLRGPGQPYDMSAADLAAQHMKERSGNAAGALRSAPPGNREIFAGKSSGKWPSNFVPLPSATSFRIHKRAMAAGRAWRTDGSQQCHPAVDRAELCAC
jgi:hypothetical protein